MAAVAIIIPTFNNYEYLAPCLQSILTTMTAEDLLHIYVVNNGHENSCDWIKNKHVTVLQSEGKNLGWEGALKLGLEKTTEPFVMFLNDDTLIPPSSRFWINRMLQHFIHKEVGAVGPSSNVVMGLQNIFTSTPVLTFTAKFLIGFCFLVRREAILKAGGIDDSLPGGDDLDMSIRLRDAGFKLVVDKEVFVYHHGFKTGNRVFGDVAQRNGWNSYEMLEKTNNALIRKHGFRKWWDCIRGAWEQPTVNSFDSHDSEGDLIRERIKPGTVIDLGCGGNKTIPEAIGVDMIPKDEVIATLHETKSSADINADVSMPLPFEDEYADTIIQRHILEHLVDTISSLQESYRILKSGGLLIIAVPNNSIIQSIPMNIEHVHGFSLDSLRHFGEAVGFETVEQLDGKNGISFITVFRKP